MNSQDCTTFHTCDDVVDIIVGDEHKVKTYMAFYDDNSVGLVSVES